MPPKDKASKITFENLDVFYAEKQVAFNVNLAIKANQVTAFIGPSGCGKSTLLRCINRMNDVIPQCHMTGRILVDNIDIYGNNIDVHDLRANIGMVFQKPNPFPKTRSEDVV